VAKVVGVFAEGKKPGADGILAAINRVCSGDPALKHLVKVGIT
jgi:hypothetical protein